MRLYGRKLFDRATEKRTRRSRSVSEGIVWTVDEESQRCTVRLQGSDEQVVCHYPRNLVNKPSYLKVGNSVQISHKNGNRRYAMIVGEGRAVPTAQTGSQFPTLGALSDSWLTSVKITVPTEGLSTVIISPVGAQYRINGITYTLGSNDDYLTLDDSSHVLIDTYPFIYIDQLYIVIPAAPSSGYYRYDILVAGTDGAVDIVSGTAATSNPIMPATPANHILIDYILRIGGENGAYQKWVGYEWAEESLSSLAITAAEELAWDYTTWYPEFTIKITILDQYGNALANSDGWKVTGQLLVGSGQLYSENSGYGTTVSQIFDSSYYNFKYKRNQLLGAIAAVSIWTLEKPGSNMHKVLIQKELGET